MLVAEVAGAFDGEADALVFALGRMTHFQDGDEVANAHLGDAAIAGDDANAVQALVEDSTGAKRDMTISECCSDESCDFLIGLHNIFLLQRRSL